MPVAPVPGSISHKFGEDRGTRRHNGVDYAVEEGTPVRAAASGRVVRSTMHKPTEEIVIGKKGKKEKKFRGSYGNVIIIYHGQDIETFAHIYTLYAHLEERSVRVKDEVRLGQVIGSSGRTGTRQGHYNWKGGYELHFEVISSSEGIKWLNLDAHFAAMSKRKDPERFLRRSEKSFCLQLETDTSGPRPLTDREKAFLKPYIPQVVLDNAVLHIGKMPFYAPDWAAAITRGNNIYFNERSAIFSTPKEMALLAHELVHVGQYRDGMTWLEYISASAGALLRGEDQYHDNRFEIEASKKEVKIQQSLNSKYGGKLICP